jgi:hypothetical protein
MSFIIARMSKKLYTAYGLVFQSEWEIPELLEGDGHPDVTLRIGEVPAQLESFTSTPQLYQVSESQFLLKMEGIASYWVKNGNEIVIQPAPGSLDSEVRLFLFGTCLGVLLHQRGILALHASAIETPQGAVLFCGPSGIGKSTLMSAFLNLGYYMLSDDVTGIVLDHAGFPIVLPAMPRSKLWSDAVNHLGHDLNTLPRLRPNEEKFELVERERFAHCPVPLRNIYLLVTGETESPEITPLDHLMGFQVILDNTYRELFLDGLDRRTTHLQLAAATAKIARISVVSRPANLLQLDEMVKLVEADFLASSPAAAGSSGKK